MNQKPPRRETTSPRRLAFAQIKLAKINLSLFGRLALSEVEDERRAVLLLSFDQDVEDVGLDGAPRQGIARQRSLGSICPVQPDAKPRPRGWRACSRWGRS